NVPRLPAEVEGGGEMKQLLLVVAALFGSIAFGQNRAPELHVLPVQGNIYMLVGAGGNIALSLGPDGILMVDSGRADMSPQVLSTALQLVTAVAASPEPNRCSGLHCANSPYRWTSPSLNAIISSPARPKPVRYIINTSIDADHTGGNEKLAQL